MMFNAPVHAPEPQKRKVPKPWVVDTERKESKTTMVRRQYLSEVELETLPFATHDGAARTATTHGSEARLHRDNRTADDLANAVCTAGTNALGAGKAAF
jgi:hypothetical protein